MAHKLIFLLAVVGVANAGLLGAGYGLAAPAYSTQSLTIAAAPIAVTKVLAAPAATSSQSFERISKSTGYIAAAPAYSYAAAAPAYSYASAAPAYSYASTSVPAYSYAAPAISYAAPKVLAAPAYSYATLSAPATTYAAAAPAYSYAAAAPAYSYAAPIAVAAPKLIAAPAIATIKAEPYDPNPQYKYSYGVSDPHTGDVKSASEVRDGDVVKGQYSLIDSDGTRRVVDYAADSHSGFNAIVRKEPLLQKVAIAAPVAVAAPLVTKTISYGGYGY